MSMNKNAVVELITAMHAARTAEQASFVERAASEQSSDEQKELLASAKRAATHAKYIARMIDNAHLLDAVASQVAQLKISELQIRDIESDAYSLRKFAELMISFVQKRKVDDEHSFSEALAVIASGVLESDATSFGKKMTAKDGSKYGARQAQMSLKLLERLKACKVKQDGRNKIFVIDTDSAVYKRIIRAYE